MTPFWKKSITILDKYSILVSAIVIYAYFLFTSIDLMGHAKTKKTILDFVLQFDSLILMWVIAFVVVKLQKYRSLNNEQMQRQKKLQTELDQQRSKLKLVEEVTLLFQESITKPLTVVSTVTKNLRERLDDDPEGRTWVDHIDFAMARVSATANDIRTYETQKIVGESAVLGSPTPPRK